MRPRVLFVYQLPAPFILTDRDLLRKFADVKEFRWFGRPHPARLLTRWMLRNRAAFDIVFIWFGDAHASVATRMARLLGKPSVLVAGGYDVNDLPGYGYLSTARGRRSARGHFSRATRILAVSDAIRRELVRRFPSTASKSEVLYLGVDVDRFRPGGHRERRVLSVAGAEGWKRAWVKGWDRIAEVARLLPDIPFRIVGASRDVAEQLDPPPNLVVRPHASEDELLAEYRASPVYLQASRTEALSSAVMEAMACGCVPVVTNVGGMPELVGNAGLVTNEDPIEIAAAVRAAFDAQGLGVKARSRVLQRFSLAAREEGLRRVIDGALARLSA